MLKLQFSGLQMGAGWMQSRSLCLSLMAVLGAAGPVHALDEQARAQQPPLNLTLPSSFEIPAGLRSRMRNAEQERLQSDAQRQMPDLRMRKPYGAGYEMRMWAASSAPVRARETWAGAVPEASATGARGLTAGPGHGSGRGGR